LSNNPSCTKVFGLCLSGVSAFFGAGGLWASEAGAVGPDAIAQVGSELPVVWGCVDGIQAYSTRGGVCNVGNLPLPGDLTANHPMWTQNLYRLKDNRFEQIGMSWVKHTAWSDDEGPCTACGVPEDHCHPPDPDTPFALDPGCRDIYTACENSRPEGPRSQINPSTGAWPVGAQVPPCDTASAIACRLQVKMGDLAPVSPPAKYFLEQQVITPDDAAAGNQNNNVSYKTATVGPCAASLCTLTNQCDVDPSWVHPISSGAIDFFAPHCTEPTSRNALQRK
jgi:hypothetical protein